MIQIMTYTQQGFCCSQTLLMMGLDAMGHENRELIRAMGGLCGGIANAGKACGALSGGACLLSLYVGRGSEDEMEIMFGRRMLDELVRWFDDVYGSQYGGTTCMDLLEGNPANRIQRCPDIINAVYEQVCDILASYGYSIESEREAML
ncbi:C_GCAxxG_C_C family protein [Fusibacter paucivorans]|uniref:C_GCAxxG_C_C family protein n=2 Tax=Fusibacter paucivorans TaxID=76009 RepID=A0ABS5PTE5_9FIRM|nr:C_GCAxxG_C_C family protein [Fusibacter paucivorans]